MSALDTLWNIIENKKLNEYDFKFCLVDKIKRPWKTDNTLAKPNNQYDFICLNDLLNTSIQVLNSYDGLGVSIQASNICAIDVDHCFSNAFDIDSISDLGLEIVEMFKNNAYIEFSFSGHGLRFFFNANEVSNYQNEYYTKNSRLNIEYYYPEGSSRYVTITGRTIVNNRIQAISDELLKTFLDKYMKREHSISNKQSLDDTKSIDELMKEVKLKYLTDNSFQELWFNQAPGSGHDESERDYHLVAYLYDFVTQDKDKIKAIFEQSPFFKSKDYKHIQKWNKQNFRYFNYLYSRISSK